MSHELKVERLFDAPASEVFDAFVDSDAQREIYGGEGSPIVELEEPQVGGRWTIAFGPSRDALYRETSAFEVVERPRRLVTTSSMTMLVSGFLSAEVRDDYAGGLPGFLDRFEGVVMERART